METRASRKRALASSNVVVENHNIKRKRVVLGELPISPNLTVPSTLNSQKEKLRPNRKKPGTATKKNLDLSQVDEPYVPDIYTYVRNLEEKRRPMANYLEKVQKDAVTPHMRGILVDWLVEVAEEYKLLPHTLHLSVSYIDRFLSLNTVHKQRLQLLGVSSMLIASKYEEIDPPRVKNFCYITDNTYNKAEIVKMEADILKSLKFELGDPTANTFIRGFADAASGDQKTPNLKLEYLCSYLAELSLLDYDCVRFLPSVVAASAIFLARFIIWPEVHPWTLSLCKRTGYKSVELKDCVLLLHNLYLVRRAVSFRAIRDKYKQHKFKSVANLPSPPEIPKHYFEQE